MITLAAIVVLALVGVALLLELWREKRDQEQALEELDELEAERRVRPLGNVERKP